LIKCRKECGNSNTITIESIKNNFTSPAWKAINDTNSITYKYLTHANLKEEEEGNEENEICFETFATIGFLLCPGKPAEKVEILFNILQEGGLDEHQSISATDKDFLPFW